ncbi:TPA: autotransporter outer membrane beta-barrel domain-containing protein, partial [Escherichia coli]|nr:autotransporter outer membrane beta-barrel domain-containing protein [Escherichia coli]
MSGAELTLSSQGGLILKGDTGCPEEGCSWTVKNLTLDNGAVAFYDTAAVSDGGYQSLTTGSLSGNGNFYMHTNVAAGQGDRLVVTGTAEGNHRVYVADTGVSPEAGTDLTLVTTGGGDAAFVLGNEGGMVDIGTYEYTLKEDTDNTGGNSWRLTEYVAPEPPTP